MTNETKPPFFPNESDNDPIPEHRERADLFRREVVEYASALQRGKVRAVPELGPDYFIAITHPFDGTIEDPSLTRIGKKLARERYTEQLQRSIIEVRFTGFNDREALQETMKAVDALAEGYNGARDTTATIKRMQDVDKIPDDVFEMGRLFLEEKYGKHLESKKPDLLRNPAVLFRFT